MTNKTVTVATQGNYDTSKQAIDCGARTYALRLAAAQGWAPGRVIDRKGFVRVLPKDATLQATYVEVAR